MEKRDNKFTAAIKRLARQLFGRNLALKILSLVFAILLWGYVIAEINPMRTKLITNVPVTFEGEADLRDRGLVVRGIRSQLLRSVSVEVSAELTQYADLSASNLTAYVSLREITATDDGYRARVVVVTNVGTVERWSPQYITLEIDNYATKSIPVEVQYEGTLPLNYWAGTPQLSSEAVEIRGAAKDVNRVSRAVCRVTLTDRTQSYNDAVDVVFLDAAGEVVDSGYFIGEMPTVAVKLKVLPKKRVPVDLAGALLGEDNLAVNYEIVDSMTNPLTVEIAGPQELLDGIDSITLENSINLAGRSESVLEQVPLKVPEGVQLLGGPTVEAYVEIQEKETDKLLRPAYKTIGLGSGLTVASIAPEANEAIVKGRISLISDLDDDDLTFNLDLTGLTAGTYTVPVTVAFKSAAVQNEVEYMLMAQQVSVRIARK